jgi:hypothetical protein
MTIDKQRALVSEIESGLTNLELDTLSKIAEALGDRTGHVLGATVKPFEKVNASFWGS